MVRSARRTRHPSCELARGHCQDRRPAGSRAAGSVRMIGAPPGQPGGRRALRRRSSAYPEVALEGPFAEVLANAYSEYVRAAAAWQADPTAHSQAAQRLGTALRVAHERRWPWALLGAHVGISATRASQLATPIPPGTAAPAWLPKLADYQDELDRARAERLAAGQTKAAPERAGEGRNSRAGAPGDAQRRWGTPGRPPPRGF